ncbi:MAG: type II toxin-antitoxin system VapC family toxin [Candidatus Acidiferrum sp.]
MNYLLDTNVVSEWAKPRPNAGVVRWLADQDEDRLFLSVITLAELRHGVEQMRRCVRRERLNVWIEDELRERFEGRILSIHEGVADAWGRLMAMSESRGKRMNVTDGFLAAIATVWGLSLVTRDIADFKAAGCAFFNPWNEQDR